jgi:hypothetical protein
MGRRRRRWERDCCWSGTTRTARPHPRRLPDPPGEPEVCVVISADRERDGPLAGERQPAAGARSSLVLLRRRSGIETAGSRRERLPRPSGVMAPSAAKRPPEAASRRKLAPLRLGRVELTAGSRAVRTASRNPASSRPCACTGSAQTGCAVAHVEMRAARWKRGRRGTALQCPEDRWSFEALGRAGAV